MRHIKAIGIGVCLGLLLVAVQKALHIDTDVFMRWYWIVALLGLGGVLLINIVYNIPYQRKIKELIPLLDSEKTEEYLAGVEALLRTAKGNGLQTMLKINLSAGYITAKQYDKAVRLLEEMPPKHLRGSVLKLCRCLNLGLSYFETKQYTRAVELYTENQELFDRYRNHKIYGGNIALANILLSLGKGEYGQASQQLAAARKAWDTPRLQKSFQEIEEILAKGSL